MDRKLPQVEFCGRKISRLIVGGNPFSGFSHIDSATNAEMEDYYSADNIKKALRSCLENGIDTALLRGDRHIVRMLREFRLDGNDINWIGQSTPENVSFESVVRYIKGNGAFCLYHHGTETDKLFRAGEYAEIKRRLDVIRESGLPVGLGSHMPAVFEYAEEHHWNADFYTCCVYDIDKNPGRETFDEDDPPRMYEFIRSTDKPCLAFKILGAGRKCATPETVEAAFRTAFENIKPTDAVVVGIFQKYGDQAAQNAEIVKRIAGQP